MERLGPNSFTDLLILYYWTERI